MIVFYDVLVLKREHPNFNVWWLEKTLWRKLFEIGVGMDDVWTDDFEYVKSRFKA